VNGPIVFLAATAFVSASATLGVSMLRLPSRIDAALAWALLASTVVVATLLVAGAVLDELAAWLVLALNAAVAGLFALAWLALGRGHSKLRRPSIGDVHALVRELRGDRWLLLLLVVAAGEVLWRLTIAYLMPPYAADALWYHLTTVGGWLQEDQIGPSDLSIWSTVYPYNGELLFTWPALLLGDDTFVDAVQLPFAIVAAVAVAGIGRTAGLSTRGAAAAGCLFLLAPIVLSQTTANYTDLIFTAFFLSSFHFVLRFAADLRATGGGSPAHLFVAGLAGGLALGTKVLGVIYLGVLALLLVAHLLAARVRWRLNGKRLVWSLILFVVPVLALGFYHYVETWVRYGNPLYPVRIAAFGVELFSGRSVDWFLTPPLTEGAWWREIWGQWRQDYFFLVRPRFHAYSYDDRGSGLGPLWSYLALPLLPVFAFRLFRTNRAVLLNVLLPVALMVALQPYRWWSRFTMILIAVGAIAIVAVVEALPRRWSTALKVAVLGLVALGIAFPTLKIDGEFWALRILSVVRIPAHERTIGRIALPGYRWVDAAPKGARIGVDTSSTFLGGGPSVFAYPLFGRRFEHRVYPLPRTAEAVFARTILDKRLSYVFVGRGKRIDRWMQHASGFGCADVIYHGPLYSGSVVRAYRTRPNCEWLSHARTARRPLKGVLVRTGRKASCAGRPASLKWIAAWPSRERGLINEGRRCCRRRLKRIGSCGAFCLGQSSCSPWRRRTPRRRGRRW
jgi:hypothetical protein